MASNSTIVALMQNASREARELEALASDEADFWPLTPIAPSDKLWAAWQLHRPASDDGYVMYFRRSLNDSATFAVPWAAVSTTRTYKLSYRYSYVEEDGDHPPAEGSALRGLGLEVTLPEPASSLLVHYSAVG